MARTLPLSRALLPAALVAGLALPAAADGPAPLAPPVSAPAVGKPIDLVLCLDTSGSMEGLIHSARQKMWEVVNLCARARPTPVLRVALLTYGSPGHDDTGHVVVQTDLTADLDLVSERLFALTTVGGDEYVGRVIQHALDRLRWSEGNAMRVLFVAGNESADQDKVVAPFRTVVRRAAARGVRVNAIYCRRSGEDVVGEWREVAALGDGRFAEIEMNTGTLVLQTPFDRELGELSASVNTTYVGYGAQAREGLARQRAQDEAAGGAAPSAPAERAAAKAGGLYKQSWDLVDRMEEAGFDIAKVADADLPEEMRPMTLEQRKAHLAKKKAERAEIQGKIRDLDAKRRAYLKDEMARKGLDDTQALDRALRDAIREQAAAVGFTFADAPAR